MGVKICRKEAKESQLFLRLLEIRSNSEQTSQRELLEKEARELVLIFSAIIGKSRGTL